MGRELLKKLAPTWLGSVDLAAASISALHAPLGSPGFEQSVELTVPQ
jgi:hypothetical protein